MAKDRPDVLQAGSRNHTAVSLSIGLAGHPHAWAGGAIQYHAHVIPTGVM